MRLVRRNRVFYDSAMQPLRTLFAVLTTTALLLGTESRADPNTATAREVTGRLWNQMDAASGKVRHCQVNDVLRPALGCGVGRKFFKGSVVTSPEGAAIIDLARPAWLRGEAAVVEATRNPRALLDDGALPPLLMPWGSGRLRGKIPDAGKPGEEISLLLRAIPITRETLSWQSKPLRIEKDNNLLIHLGLDPRGVAVGAGAARLRVALEIDGERHPLLDEVLSPKTAGEWQRREASLALFAGRVGSFVFEAIPEAGPGSGLIAPLFGAPELTGPVQDRRRPSVILISLDTLRGDFLGQIRDGRSLTENLDAFSQTGAMFSQAMTTYSSTSASHMSMLTGLYPSVHNVVHPRARFDEEIPMAATFFADAGYFTGAVTENAMIAPSSGFSRGFDYYREEHGTSHERRFGFIEETLATAAAWIRAHREDPFFFFIHSYQVHMPYEPPEAYDRFQGKPAWLAAANLSPTHLRRLNGYTGEVLYTDAVVGRFLDDLDRLGLPEDTIVVITSDHGEEFGVHGTVGHSGLLRESVMRIPLLIRAPGRIPANTRIDSVVSLVDLLPTLLDLTGQSPLADTHGISLMRYIDDPTNLPKRAVYGENRRKDIDHVTARTDTHRFLSFRAKQRPLEIFATSEDPLELSPVDTPALQAEGQALIARYLAQVEGHQNGRGTSASVAPDTAAKLRALGYTD